MNWDAIGAIGEIVGAIAVVTTLGYLAIQVRQSNASSNSVAIQAFFNSMETISTGLIDQPKLRDAFGKGMNEWDTLSREEQQLLHIYWGNFATKLHMGFRLYKRGVLDEESWATWEAYFLSSLQTEGVRRWWEIAHPIYADDFVTRIHTRIADSDTLPPPITETMPYFLDTSTSTEKALSSDNP